MNAPRTVRVVALVVAALVVAGALLTLRSEPTEGEVPQGAPRRDLEGADPVQVEASSPTLPERAPTAPAPLEPGLAAPPRTASPRDPEERVEGAGHLEDAAPVLHPEITELEVLVLGPDGSPVPDAQVLYDSVLGDGRTSGSGLQKSVFDVDVRGDGRTDGSGLLKLVLDAGLELYGMSLHVRGMLPTGLGVGHGWISVRGGSRGTRVTVTLELAAEVTLAFDRPLREGRLQCEEPWGRPCRAAEWSEPRERFAFLLPLTALGRYRVAVWGTDDEGRERWGESAFELGGSQTLRLATVGFATLSVHVSGPPDHEASYLWIEGADPAGGALLQRRARLARKRLEEALTPPRERGRGVAIGGEPPRGIGDNALPVQHALPRAGALSLSLPPGSYELSATGSTLATAHARERIELAADERRELGLKLARAEPVRVDLGGDPDHLEFVVQGPPGAWLAREGDALLIGGLGSRGARVLAGTTDGDRVGLLELAPGQRGGRLDLVAPGTLDSSVESVGRGEVLVERLGSTRFPAHCYSLGSDLPPLGEVDLGEVLYPGGLLQFVGPPLAVEAPLPNESRHRLEGLHPGRYRVSLRRDDRPPEVLVEAVTIESGQVTRLDLERPR